MNNPTLLLFILAIRLTFGWVQFTIPFPKQTFSMTYSGIKSQDMSLKEIVLLTNDQIVIRDLATTVQTFVPYDEVPGDVLLKAYFEDHISTFFQLLADGVLRVCNRQTSQFSEIQQGVLGMTISGQYGFFITSSQVFRITYPSLQIETRLLTQTLTEVISMGKGFITVRSTSNTLLFDQDLNSIRSVGGVATFIPQFQIGVRHGNLNLQGISLSIFDENNVDLAQKGTTGYFYQIFGCSTMIISIQSTDNTFYNFTSQTSIDLLTTTTNTGVSVPKLGAKCYQDDLKFVLVSTSSSNSNHFQLNIYSYGTLIQDQIPSSPQEQQDILIPETSETILTEAEKKIYQFNKAIIETISSENFGSATKHAASATGILASNPLTRQGIRPFFNFFEDLWFYGFHPIMYPEFIQSFTTQVDILNVLKLKPQFLDFIFSIHWVQQSNEEYILAKQEQTNSPETVFMLQSIKDIYTVNLPLSFVQFFFLFMTKKLCSKFRNKHKIFFYIFRFLRNQCLWFTLIITIFQNCIVPISFYGGIQFNNFFTFDFTSKINCIFTIILVLVIILFSFTFFAFIKKYSKPSTSRQLLDFSQYFAQSFWLETCTRCVRGLLQGLIHGFFLHVHPIQLPLLILLDLIFVFIIFQCRKCFIHVVLFVFTLFYFMLFAFLDTFLLYYTVRSRSTDIQQLSNNIILNFISIIVVIALLFSASIKCVFFIVMTIYDLIKGLCKKEQVKKVSVESQEGFRKKTENLKRSKPKLNALICQNLAQQSLKNPQGKQRTSKQVLLKVHNRHNIIEEPLSALPLNGKKNRMKKISNLDRNMFDKSRSMEFVRVHNKQNNGSQFQQCK